MPKSDHRLFERYELKVPALLHPSSDATFKQNCLVLSRDISCGGAYFHTSEPQSYSGRVQVEMLMKIPTQDEQPKYIYMTTTGEVMRHEATGVAIKFDDSYSLSPFV